MRAHCSTRPARKTGLRPTRSENAPATGPTTTAVRLDTVITASISPRGIPATEVP